VAESRMRTCTLEALESATRQGAKTVDGLAHRSFWKGYRQGEE
jgi:hypothetical protein